MFIGLNSTLKCTDISLELTNSSIYETLIVRSTL